MVDLCEELQEHVRKPDITTLNLLLPTSSARGLFSSLKHQPVAVKQNFQSLVTSPHHALSILLSLIAVMSRSYTGSDSSRAKTKAAIKFQTWFSRTLTRVQPLLWTLSTSSPSKVAAQYLITICQGMQTMRTPGSCTVLLEKTAYLSIDHICAMFSTLLASELASCELQLLEGAKLLQAISTTSLRVRERLRLGLLPHMSQRGADYQPIGTALQRILLQSQTISSDCDIEMTNANSKADRANAPTERPTKRMRYDNSVVQDAYRVRPQTVLDTLCQAFGVDNTNNIHDLETKIAASLSQPTDIDQALGRLSLFTQLPCSGAVDLRTPTEPDDQCDICLKTRLSSTWSQEHWSGFYRILSAFLKSSDLQASKAARALLQVTIRHFVAHTPIIEHLDLTKSILGAATLQGLRSSAREVRIAAVNALPTFLKHSIYSANDIVRQNRITVLNILQQTLEGQDARLWESSIRALGLIATTCEDEEMNIVLLRLVECLGSTNNLVCELAQLELQDLAHVMKTSLDDIFRPFWKTIAISVTKDLQSRPQKAQKLADILGRSVDELLLHTQEDIVPFLVLRRHSDILERIANARGPDRSIRQLCMQPKIMTLVLASLLIQDPKRLESTIQGYLVQASAEFRRVSVSEMLRADVVPIACELLRMASDAQDAAQQKVLKCHCRQLPC
jgi:hypothetical protein